jgi:hypothetical protein
MFLFLQVTLGLGAFSTVVTLLLIGTGHRDNYILSHCSPDSLSPRKMQDSIKKSIGDRYYRYLAIASRYILAITFFKFTFVQNGLKCG